jgi:2-polyprenyl-6-methoxyphenol hydroxylase-like FAD-dependent oxidoreductase
MTSIGIVGTGISGLQLALTLQQAGIDTTLYAERTPDEMRQTRLPNTVSRFGPTLARERALGVDHWAGSPSHYQTVHVSVVGTPVYFNGRFQEPVSNLDFRVYLSRLLEDYAARGGHVVAGRRSVEQIVDGTADHDLTVVAAGRDSVREFFPRDASRSPFDKPQRIITACILHGIAPVEPLGADIHLVPEVGEIFTLPYLSRHGIQTAIAIEGVPGGPLAELANVSYDDDPKGFEAHALDLLRRYAPRTYERVDVAEFAVTHPLDVLQGAIVPTVRKPYCEVAPGKFVVAVGDAYVANDPVGGQGANLGSSSAAVVAEAILRDVAFDEWFCRGLERDLWAAAEPVVNFNNAFLGAPPPHVQELLGAATASQAVADAFGNLWAAPADMWRTIATPERAAAFLAKVGAPAPVAAMAA